MFAELGLIIMQNNETYENALSLAVVHYAWPVEDM